MCYIDGQKNKYSVRECNVNVERFLLHKGKSTEQLIENIGNVKRISSEIRLDIITATKILNLASATLAVTS
jgi:hypothetical protein